MLNFLNGFRKWSLAIIYLAVSVALLVTGQIGSVDWMKYTSEVIAAFMATNIGEHAVNVTRDWLKGRETALILRKFDETTKL